MTRFLGLLLSFAFTCGHAEESSCSKTVDATNGNAMLQYVSSVGSTYLQVSRRTEADDWSSGTATFYGDGGSGGACGGSELGEYGTAQSWIDGLYAATASSMWCGEDEGSCGSTHSTDCGRCYEVKCVGTTTNSDGYEPCIGSTVTVAVTDECPGGSALLQVNQTNALTGHCGGDVRHLDLSTKAFKVIGNERAGVIDIHYRRVSCSARGNLKLRFHGTQWHFKVAPWDVNGPGSLKKFEVKNEHLVQWTSLKPSYGAFWLSDVDIKEGPYEFRLTADDGQVLIYELEKSIASVSGSVLDIGKNFQNTPDSSRTTTQTLAPTETTSVTTTLQATVSTSVTTSSMTSTTESSTTTMTTSQSTVPSTSVENGGGECNRGWSQCGGKGFKGSACCTKGFDCVFDNDWWSMCKPSAAQSLVMGPTTTTPDDESAQTESLHVSSDKETEDWSSGTATFYGDGGSGGACGGSELGEYGSGQSWIDGLYAATASHMWCGANGGSCGSTHSSDCGRCYEVKCVGTTTNSDGYEPCTGSTVTVAVTDECPGGSALLQVNQTNALTGHCGGDVRHLDLSTKAFKVIGDERAGVIDIQYRRVSCSARGNLKLRFHGTRWHFKVAPWDVNGPGSLKHFEVKNEHLGQWTALKPSYGAFWLSDVDIKEGPYEFRLTADDGQVLIHELEKSIAFVSGSVLDIGKNFQNTPDSSRTTTQSLAPTATTSVTTTLQATMSTSVTTSMTSTTVSSTTTMTTSQSTVPSTSVESGGEECNRGWSQCGGKGFKGSACCKKGFDCVFDNDWWSMCQPSAAQSSVVSTTARSTATITTATTTTTTPDESAQTECVRGWGQCGGKGFKVPSCCKEGYECVFDNEWWSICKPVSAA